MKPPHLPLNALRAFEASARQLSFTRAGLELRVTQAAVSHHVKSLEAALGVQLFRRLPRGLALTDEGQALLPTIAESFDRIRATIEHFEDGYFREVITIGVVGTFAAGWLLPRLRAFETAYPHIDLRLLTNNNRVDLAGEGLDFAIRFRDGLWHGTEATRLLAAPLSPFCAPNVARRLRKPSDLKREILLRSYRPDEWPRWFAAAGITAPRLTGPTFDSSIIMAEVAARGGGVALLPAMLFGPKDQQGRIVRPFKTEIALGDYWLTWLRSKHLSPALLAFKDWLLGSIAAQTGVMLKQKNNKGVR